MFESSKCFLSLLLLLNSCSTFLANSKGVESLPPTATIECETTKGSLTIEVHHQWSPLGAERFVALVKDGFFTDIAFYRCVKRFLTQFGISDNESMKHWQRDTIPDDPNLHLGIQKNYVSFAGGGPNTRSSQIFIAFEYLDFLGKEPWETPFGVVVKGQSTLDALYKEYGDMPPFGKGPDQGKINNRGNQYVRDNFPKIDFMQSCKVVAEEVSMVYIHHDDNTKSNEAIATADGQEDLPVDEPKDTTTVDDEKKEKIIPRGPDELDKLSTYEKKARFRKGANSLKDQLKKSEDSKLSYESISEKAANQKAFSAMYAVILLSILIGVLYYLHRDKAVTAAVGKRS